MRRFFVVLVLLIFSSSCGENQKEDRSSPSRDEHQDSKSQAESRESGTENNAVSALAERIGRVLNGSEEQDGEFASSLRSLPYEIVGKAIAVILNEANQDLRGQGREKALRVLNMMRVLMFIPIFARSELLSLVGNVDDLELSMSAVPAYARAFPSDEEGPQVGIKKAQEIIDAGLKRAATGQEIGFVESAIVLLRSAPESALDRLVLRASKLGVEFHLTFRACGVAMAKLENRWDDVLNEVCDSDKKREMCCSV